MLVGSSPPLDVCATFVGKFLLHFNRHGAAPRVWSIDIIEQRGGADFEGAEINVSEIVWFTPTRTVYRAKATPDDEGGKPSAWLETEGTLRIYGQFAEIR